MVQAPYYGGNNTPPLFVAELDSQPGRPSESASHYGPDGTPVFEMSSEPVLPQRGKNGNPSSLSDQCPSSLQDLGVPKPERPGEKQENKLGKDPTSSVIANPWAYFGPEPSDVKFQETQRPQTANPQPSKPEYRPYPGDSDADPPEVPHDTRPSPKPPSPDIKKGDHAFYPAPLKLAHRPPHAISPPTFKAYTPPASQDSLDLQSTLSGGPDRTDSQSPTASNTYQPYRPHSPQPCASSVPASSTRPATTSPLQSAPPLSPSTAPQQQPAGTVPHHFNSTVPPIQPLNPSASSSTPPKPGNSFPISPSPQTQQPEPQPQLQYGIPSASPVQPMPPSAPTYLPSPMTPSGQLSSVVSSPATPATNAGAHFTQQQYAAIIAVPSYAQTPTSVLAPPSPGVSSPSHHTGVPYAVPIQAHSLGLNQLNITPHQQATPPGPKIQQIHAQPPHTEPCGIPAPTVIPQSPPPPYAPQDIVPQVGAQPPALDHPVTYQPSPTAPYPPQPQYSAQSPYASATGPPLPTHLGNSLQPPALPPRPASSQGFAPTSGFGAGPAGYNPANYPRPPQTYFAPPPALPPRPGLGKLAGGGGKLFGSASADKWLRKTGQVLENTLAPYLQGQSGHSGSYQSSPNGLQGQQGQSMQQASGQYPSQGPHFHVPHLAPQYRGASDSGHLPQGYSAPGR
ncbi:hypothetical protein FBEOM_12691 [Fusarium beomiforme]|uniref:Uncharacterized protein n=1 Tax=Fusarium beomiforme TaxID=44412 RepID=A0A9P5DST2_9HYPO|nr:hypothetical protein FBEOM_12691 [Fusarium beomiforme]